MSEADVSLEELEWTEETEKRKTASVQTDLKIIIGAEKASDNLESLVKTLSVNDIEALKKINSELEVKTVLKFVLFGLKIRVEEFAIQMSGV